MKQPGLVYKKGTLWRIWHYERGKFLVVGINKDGSREKTGNRRVNGLDEYDFAVDETVPPESKSKP